MTASHDRRNETSSISGGRERRGWVAPAVRRLSAGSAEAGGATIPDGMFGFS